MVGLATTRASRPASRMPSSRSNSQDRLCCCLQTTLELVGKPRDGAFQRLELLVRDRRGGALVRPVRQGLRPGFPHRSQSCRPRKFGSASEMGGWRWRLERRLALGKLGLLTHFLIGEIVPSRGWLRRHRPAVPVTGRAPPRCSSDWSFSVTLAVGRVLRALLALGFFVRPLLVGGRHRAGRRSRGPRSSSGRIGRRRPGRSARLRGPPRSRGLGLHEAAPEVEHVVGPRWKVAARGEIADEVARGHGKRRLGGVVDGWVTGRSPCGGPRRRSSRPMLPAVPGHRPRADRLRSAQSPSRQKKLAWPLWPAGA